MSAKEFIDEKTKAALNEKVWAPMLFPFSEGPASGEVIDIHDDIKWARSPLPMSLDHINCYLIRDGHGWCLVDTGMEFDESKASWLNVLESALNGEPITRVIATHQHPDHIGLCGWFCEKFQAPLFMSELEFFHAQAWLNMKFQQPYWESQQFFTRTNLRADSQEIMSTSHDMPVAKLPATYHRLTDQETVLIGEHKWKIITTKGHSPQHVSLYCEKLDILLSGDQVLPKITSNVSVHQIEPDQSPLTDWYASHTKIEQQVPDSVLVLPSHELPFTGLHRRLHDVINHHNDRMKEIEALAQQPIDAQTLTDKLFKRDLESVQNYLAVGEVIAHLHKMMEDKRIVRTLDSSVYFYQVT